MGVVLAGSKSGIDSASENIYVTGGYTWSGYSSNWAPTKGYSRECVRDTPDTCFRTSTYQYSKQHYAFLNIPTSSVTQIKLLSYGKFLGSSAFQRKNFHKPSQSLLFLVTDWTMAGTTVFVCMYNYLDCTQCGEPTTVDTSRNWAVFNCDTPIIGNLIKVTQYSHYMAFCEVKISDDLIIESR